MINPVTFLGQPEQVTKSLKSENLQTVLDFMANCDALSMSIIGSQMDEKKLLQIAEIRKRAELIIARKMKGFL